MPRPLNEVIFIDYLKRCRKAKKAIGFTKYWKLCPVSRFTIYNWRRRNTKPYTNSIKRLAKFLNLSYRNVYEAVKLQKEEESKK